MTLERLLKYYFLKFTLLSPILGKSAVIMGMGIKFSSKEYKPLNIWHPTTKIKVLLEMCGRKTGGSASSTT